MKAPEEQNSKANSCLEPTLPCVFNQALQVEAFIIKTLSKWDEQGLSSSSRCPSLPISNTAFYKTTMALGWLMPFPLVLVVEQEISALLQGEKYISEAQTFLQSLLASPGNNWQWILINRLLSSAMG